MLSKLAILGFVILWSFNSTNLSSVLLELCVVSLLDICCGLDAASVVDGRVCAAVDDIVTGSLS